MTPSHTLLLNWIYYYPVGHAVEAFAAAAEYRAADPDLEIHILLNSETATELGEYCPWVKGTHPIDVAEVASSGSEASCLARLPGEWDYIVSSERLVQNRPSYSDALMRCHEVIDGLTKARIWRGIRGEIGSGDGPAPAYIPFVAYRMIPTESARAWAKQHSRDGIVCSVLLGGSSPDLIYPRIEWWVRLFREMSRAFPTIHFLITGSSSSGRSTTHGYSKEELATCFSTTSNAINCYDVGIANQLALIEMSDLFISPHTGFAFLAPSVGTPWLAISGARWPDVPFARMPFCAVLPTCPEYPCFVNMLPECRRRMAEGARVRCMDDDLDSRIEEVIAGTKLLLEPSFDLTSAARTYESQAQQKAVNRGRLYTLGMLRSYGILG